MISYLNENLKRYRDEAILKGKQEGIKEGKLETARRLLGMKFDDKVVAEATGLALQEGCSF
jgi:predicted transposase/invertase (TIGR01784 family)